MKILVTGGMGFIGSNYIHYILNQKNDISIINLDKLTYAANKKNLLMYENDDRYSFIEGDICDENLVNDLVAGVDLIVHFAAESHVDRSIDNPNEFIRTNVMGTQILLNAAVNAGLKRFHHVSTDEVYGSLSLDTSDIFSETTAYKPHSPYAASKASSDHMVRAYAATYELPITISNCSNNYGPYQHTEKLLPHFITNLIEDKKIPVYGDGLNVRDWLHVEDHVRGIDLVINKGKINNTYCFGGDSEINNITIAKHLCDLFSKSYDYIEYVVDRKGHDRRYAIDFAKASQELDWYPEHSFNSGIIETIEWYKSHKDWWTKQ